MPNIELKNWAKNSVPDPESVSAHLAERMGSMGPRKVITIPVRRKSTWMRNVPLVDKGNVLGKEALEGMIYDECKSARLPRRSDSHQ
jgi:hypothetical protein